MRDAYRSFRALMRFSFGAAPVEAALFLALGALMSLTLPVAAVGSKLLVDAATSHSARSGTLATILLAGTVTLGLLVALYYIDMLFSVAEKSGAAIDRALIDMVARIPGIAHHEQPSYLDAMDLLREDRPRLAWMTNATAGMVRVLVQLIASGVLLARLSPVLLLLPVFGLASFVTGRSAQTLQVRASEATTERERLRRHLFETGTSAAAAKELRIFGLGPVWRDRHRETSDEILEIQRQSETRAAVIQAVGGLVSGAAYAAAIGLVLFQAVSGHASPGDVVLAIGLAAGMNSLVITAVLYGTSFLRLLKTAERYLWLEGYAARSTPITGASEAPPTVLHTGISIQHLNFSYGPSSRPILDDLTLDLPAGSVVALVGENGAGKSTLVKLLCRFYEPTGGRILVDGTDLNSMDVDAWRARTASAFQDFVRFELVARETVGIGDLPRATELAAIEGALARAGAETLPQVLPRGLDTQLGRAWENGVDLSGGQWQKFALARALMRERPLLLVLDEPTASLDAETEHELFERYAQAARWTSEAAGTITLLVTHRFSTVKMADLIVVLHDGRIQEQGTHAQLVAQQGLYAELYELQARTYR